MQIFIKTLTQQTILLQVEPSDTINNIQKQIQDSEAIPLDDIFLFFEDNYLQGNLTLSDSGIQEGVTLHLRVQIFFKNKQGKNITVLFKPSDTPYEIKLLLEDKEGIPPEQQKLVFQQEELQEGIPVLEQNLTMNSTLLLDLK